MKFEPTRFNIDEAKMLDYYDKLMDQVYLLYHTHPTNLTHISLTDAEVAEMSEADAMGRSLAATAKNIAKRKKVVLHGVKGMSNGLPDTKFNGRRR